ncbi:unnamed protein product [Oppiella nova]|uniref:Uncharacterized protein n=1 Tax=Oppiella nova TaxID=334625 RepID=A0A7R9QUG0_9ACAR|nr:unnamed protein product [Oppiella nova]CAG2174480.1 unnamed protein product [Oppiella nova]
MTVKGVVLINGQAVSVAKIASISAYIQQRNLFHEVLTVREHLTFQALLRLDRNLSRAEKMAFVEKLIKKFNLTKCMDTRIGGKFAFKGISGGEMKRLSFASEVLTNPSIIDEPTTGLDSFMAENIVQVLKTMASEGRTIICTIHQPSSQVFELFDNLLLMADGRVAFMGTTGEAKDFFSSLGYDCPEDFNPSDYYINELAIRGTHYKENKAKVNKICDNYLESDYYKQFNVKMIENESRNTITDGVDTDLATIGSTYSVGYLRQTQAIMWRTYLLIVNHPQTVKQQIIRSLV